MATDPQKTRLRLKLITVGLDGLLPILQTALGQTVGQRYVIQDVLTVGSQFIVFLATDQTGGEEVIVKQALLDYRSPLKYSMSQTAQLRQYVANEFAVLTSSALGCMPRAVAQLEDAAAVAVGREYNALRNEQYVVQEQVRGITVEETALGPWKALCAGEREVRVRRLVSEFLEFWVDLYGTGFFYSDISPGNMMLEQDTGKLRVVDAASAIKVAPMVVFSACTPAYTTGPILEAATNARPLPGDISSIFPMLAKVAHFALTGLASTDGAMPNLQAAEYTRLSRPARRAMEVMLTTVEQPRNSEQALQLIGAWRET